MTGSSLTGGSDGALRHWTLRNAEYATQALTIQSLAVKLSAGEPVPLYDEQSYYSGAEWKDAADFAMATGDYDELAFMLATQADYDRWCRLSEREQDRWQGFGNWRDAYAPLSREPMVLRERGQ